MMLEYAGLSETIQQARFNYLKASNEYVQLCKEYDTAKKAYEDAKNIRIELDKKLEALLDELAKQDHVIIEGNKDETNTADSTSMCVFVGGMLLSGTLALAFVEHLKKQRS